LKISTFNIRPIKPEEIDTAAELLAAAYYDDIFFKWCVDDDSHRSKIVSEYYKIYLSSKGCVAHVAQSSDSDMEIVGVSVWLPRETEEGMYEAINNVVADYAPQFDAVANRSHMNEPITGPFYQLVGFGVAKKLQGIGLGHALLKYHIDILDKAGIPTYLEASTPYYGGGVYGKFGYKPFGELMVFTDTAVLYPLYRQAKETSINKKTAFIYDESYFWHNAGEGALYEPDGGYLEPGTYIESPKIKRRFKNLLQKSGLMDKLEKIKPIVATEEHLEYFHTKRHIENVKQLSNGDGGNCGDSAIVGRGSYEIAKLSVGGAIAAVRAVSENNLINKAFVLTRPPGHHAESDRGMGFCIFNNAVIAAKYATKNLGIKKILILDWDAHHGNGTEDAFYEDDSVLFISLHQDNLEPIGRGRKEHTGKGKGVGFTINIPLHAGSGDAVYKYAFEQIVIPAAERFKPELVIVSAGQDTSIFDPLARMMVSVAGYRDMTIMAKGIADKHAQGRIVILHEGGYCPSYVPFCSHAIVEELSGIYTDVGDPFIYAVAGTSYQELMPHQKERVEEIRDFLDLS